MVMAKMSRAACRCNPAGSARIIGGQAVFHFEGVNSISEAETFRGFEVLLPFEQRVALPAGQYFVSDLIGCSVFENPVFVSNRVFFAVFACRGAVSSRSCPRCAISRRRPFWDAAPGSLKHRNGEILIPLAVDICTKSIQPRAN